MSQAAEPGPRCDTAPRNLGRHRAVRRAAGCSRLLGISERATRKRIPARTPDAGNGWVVLLPGTFGGGGGACDPGAATELHSNGRFRVGGCRSDAGGRADANCTPQNQENPAGPHGRRSVRASGVNDVQALRVGPITQEAGEDAAVTHERSHVSEDPPPAAAEGER